MPRLFFQATNWLRAGSRETKLLAAVSAATIGTTILLSLSTGAGKVAGSTTFNRCIGHSSAFEV